MSQRKPDPPKLCAWCGSPLTRKRMKSGRLESLSAFKLRETCSLTCGASYRHSKNPLAKVKDRRAAPGKPWQKPFGMGVPYEIDTLLADVFEMHPEFPAILAQQTLELVEREQRA